MALFLKSRCAVMILRTVCTDKAKKNRGSLLSCDYTVDYVEILFVVGWLVGFFFFLACYVVRFQLRVEHNCVLVRMCQAVVFVGKQ